MSLVYPITRFLAYFPDDGGRGDEELQHLAGRMRALELTPLRKDRYLLAVQGPSLPDGGLGGALLLDVFRGTALSSRVQSADFEAAANMDEVHRLAEDCAQSYNLLQPSDASFTFESDPLGIKPVYKAHTGHGEILASRIADILLLFPELEKPADPVALYEMMTFWSPLAGRTMHRRIRCTLPGGRYTWAPGKPSVESRSRDYQPSEVDPYRLMDRTLEVIHACSDRALMAKMRGATLPALLALSGGFDSRLIAALCHDHDIALRPVSFAGRHHEEWKSARASARILGLSPERVAYRSDNVLHHLPTILETVEGTADPAAASIMPLLDLLSAPGTPLLHGFPHDVLAGSHMKRFDSADNVSLESMADAILRHYFVTSRPELRRVFEPEVNLDEVRADLLSGIRDDCPIYMAYNLWYLENRNRRYVGSQFALLGEHFDVVSPLWDRELLDVWQTVPPIGLQDRSLFRVMMQKYYPALTRIAHPDEPAPITPNLSAQLGRFLRRLPETALEGALGHKRSRDLTLRLHLNTDIMTLSKMATPQQQAYMRARIKTLEPALRDTLGMALSTEYESLLPTHLLALRSVFLVAEYAGYRANHR